MSRVLLLIALAAASALSAAQPQSRATGDQSRSYVLADTGETMRYRLYVPATWTAANKSPLVVMLHGGGLDENAPFDREPEGIKGQLFKLADRYGFILVAPLGYSKTGGFGNVMSPPPGPPPAGPPRLSPEEAARVAALSEKDTLNVIDSVASEYHVDRSRVFLMGNSMGAGGVMHLASKYPRKWLAIAPSEGAMDANRFGDKLGKLKARGVMIVKKEDTEALRLSGEELARRIGANGIVARLVVVPNSKHESAWYIALAQIFGFFDGFAQQGR